MDIQVTSLVTFVIVLLIAMSFHEAMHAFVAHWLGDTTAQEEGRLTLNPLSHIDLVMTVLLPVLLVAFGLPPILAAKPVPFNPDRVRYDEFGAALVGLAGPLTNLLLAILGAGIIRLVVPDPATFAFDFLLLFVQVNLGLFIFNMLPIPPLDGSRLLYAFAPAPLQNVMRQIEMIGILPILFLLLLLLPVLSPIINQLNTTLLRLLL